MLSWRGLPPQDLAALSAYVQTLHQAPQAKQAPPGDARRGGELFQQNCAPCHGVLGDGKGPNSTNLLPEPANFKLKQPNSDYILQILKDGIPGTGMPSWQNQLSDSDRRDLANFVPSLFEGVDSSEH